MITAPVQNIPPPEETLPPSVGTANSNGNTYVSWCCRGLGAGLHFTVSKIAQNQTSILVAGVALIGFGSLTGILPRHYSFTILKQAAFALTSEGIGYLYIRAPTKTVR